LLNRPGEKIRKGEGKGIMKEIQKEGNESERGRSDRKGNFAGSVAGWKTTRRALKKEYLYQA